MDEIIDYGTLKDAITSYLHRTDQESNIPIFCQLGIKKISRECLSVHQEDEYSFTWTAGDTAVTLPSDFKVLRGITADDIPLDQLTLYQKGLDRNNTSGTAYYYTISNNELVLHPSPDADSDVVMKYYNTISLSADTDTHNLLVANPNIFVYAAMREAAMYIENDEAIAKWGSLLSEEIISENNSTKETLWSGSPLTMISGMTTP
jgi:hypothetical protein